MKSVIGNSAAVILKQPMERLKAGKVALTKAKATEEKKGEARKPLDTECRICLGSLPSSSSLLTPALHYPRLVRIPGNKCLQSTERKPDLKGAPPSGGEEVVQVRRVRRGKRLGTQPNPVAWLTPVLARLTVLPLLSKVIQFG